MRIRVLVLPTDAQPYSIRIRNDAEEFHRLIGGYIEWFPLEEPINDHGALVGLCDEEGKLKRRQMNPIASILHSSSDRIVGTAIVARGRPDGQEFISLTDEDIENLKLYVHGYVVLSQTIFSADSNSPLESE